MTRKFVNDANGTFKVPLKDDNGKTVARLLCLTPGSGHGGRQETDAVEHRCAPSTFGD